MRNNAGSELKVQTVFAPSVLLVCEVGPQLIDGGGARATLTQGSEQPTFFLPDVYCRKRVRIGLKTFNWLFSIRGPQLPVRYVK